MKLKIIAGWVGAGVLAVIGACGAATMGACSAKVSSSGSNSNWLDRCVSDADCTSGLACVCGICTRPCSADTDCAGNGRGMVCSASAANCSEPATSAGTAPAGAACAVTCGGDADCASAGQALSCSGGFCVGSTSGGSTSGQTSGAAGSSGGASAGTGVGTSSSGAGSGDAQADSAACSTQAAAISSRMESAIGAADTTCATDTDCTALPNLTNGCYFRCGPVPVSLAGAASVENELGAIGDELCPTFAADSCTAPGPLPCPAPRNAICAAGHCALSQQPGTTGLTCQQLDTIMADRLTQAEADADKSCTTNADCTTVGRHTTCSDSCSSVPLSQAGAAKLQATLADISQTNCLTYAALGCPAKLPPPCIAPVAVICQAGTCVAGRSP